MPRTREVYPTDEIPHLYANGAVERARNPCRNLWFDGPDLYSYATRVAAIRPTAPRRGVPPGRVLLVTNRKYSMTTSGQVNAVRWAFRGHGLIVEVPHLGGWGRSGELTATDHRANLAYMRATLDEMISKARRARVHGPSLFGGAATYAETARAYAYAFKVSDKAFPAEEVRDLRAAADDPDAAERAAVAAQARETKRTDAQRRADAKRARERARAEKERAEKEAEQRLWWLAGDPNARPLFGGATVLRTIGDQVETSRGARVPVAAAHELYRFLHMLAAKGTAEKLAGHRVGHYTVTRVEADAIVIGCHTLMYTEVERWATLEGIARTPALTTLTLFTESRAA